MPYSPTKTGFDPTAVIIDNRSLRHLDFTLDANLAQDFEAIVAKFGHDAAHKWGTMDGARAFKGDNQIGNASECALRSVLEGFYLKMARKTYWADGRFITITDKGVHPGDDSLEYNTAGGRYNVIDDGITQDDLSPETSVSVAEDLTKQRFVMVKTKIEIRWQDIQKANKRGFDEFERKGVLLRRQHMFCLNNLIRPNFFRRFGTDGAAVGRRSWSGKL